MGFLYVCVCVFFNWIWKVDVEVWILTFEDTHQSWIFCGYYLLVWVLKDMYIIQVECCIVKQQDSCSVLLGNLGLVDETFNFTIVFEYVNCGRLKGFWVWLLFVNLPIVICMKMYQIENGWQKYYSFYMDCTALAGGKKDDFLGFRIFARCSAHFSDVCFPPCAQVTSIFTEMSKKDWSFRI